MTSCGFCKGQVVRVGEEEVCTLCGRVQDTDREPTFVPVMPRSIASMSKLGSFVGPMSDSGSREEFLGTGLRLGLIKRALDYVGADSTLAVLEKQVQVAAEKLGLGHIITADAVLVAGQTYARSRKSGAPTTAISVHAIATAARRAGRFDIPLDRIIETHTTLGRRFSNSRFNLLCSEFPLPTADRDAILASGVRRLFSGSGDPKLIGSILAESKRLVGLMESEGKRPQTVAATALYAACKKLGHKLTQEAAGELFGVAEYTIRESFAQARDAFEAGAE